MKTQAFFRLIVLLSFLSLPVMADSQELDRSSDTFPNWNDPIVQNSDREMMKYGYPGTDHLIFRQGYVLSYDAKHKTAHWVCEKLNRFRLKGEAKRKNNFRQDKLVDDEHRSKAQDYLNSGFDRGHLAPAKDQVSNQNAMDESFFLSNMSPQLGEGFNQQYWAYFEKKVREWAVEDDVENLYVVTGPAYLSRYLFRPERRTGWVAYRVIGDNQVAVPTHFFKVLLRERTSGEIEVQAFLIPHFEWPDDFPLDEFLVPIDELERATGLDFFNRLPDKKEKALEKAVSRTIWLKKEPDKTFDKPRLPTDVRCEHLE